MIYVPTNLDMEQSWELSAQLWQQIAPNSNGTTTKYLVAPMEHPETKEVYFHMEREEAERFDLDVENALTEWPVVNEEQEV